jgi:imidazole glycerol-phosphate synthase subunit HisF
VQPARLIPRLDIEGTNLVRLEPGIRRILGPVDSFIAHYARSGASALWLVDWQVRSWGRSLLLERLSRARTLGVPLIVSGVVRSLHDVGAFLAAGAARVGIGAEAFDAPDLVPEAIAQFGAASIAVVIDTRRHPEGHHELIGDGGSRPTGITATEWARRVVGYGCAELLVTSLDRDGTGAGYDLELAASIVDAAGGAAVTMAGGAGSIAHVRELFGVPGVSGAALASLLHVECAGQVLHRSDWSGRAVFQYLRESGALCAFRPAGLRELRQMLTDAGLACEGA